MKETEDERIWRLHVGDGPVVATAIHHGHDARDEVAKHFALDDAERLREEDPFTGDWAHEALTRVIGTRSRFEVDLNRARDKAVYRTPDDAWGLTVWKDNPPDEIFQRSLSQYDAFYDAMRTLFTEISQEHSRFVVFDLHSYNHRRDGAESPHADPEGNPQVNIGTGTMNRQKWAPVINTVIESLSSFDYPGEDWMCVRTSSSRVAIGRAGYTRIFPRTELRSPLNSKNSLCANGPDCQTTITFKRSENLCELQHPR